MKNIHLTFCLFVILIGTISLRTFHAKPNQQSFSYGMSTIRTCIINLFREDDSICCFKMYINISQAYLALGFLSALQFQRKLRKHSIFFAFYKSMLLESLIDDNSREIIIVLLIPYRFEQYTNTYMAHTNTVYKLMEHFKEK